MKKNLIIIGNGPIERDITREVDASDYIVRFNEPRISLGMSGTKTDLLMLAASSKQMQNWISGTDFLHTPIVQNTSEIMFAFHPTIIKLYHPRPNLLSKLKGRKADWTWEAVKFFGNAGKQIHIMPSQMYYEVCAELGIAEEDLKRIFPSTGFFGIWLMMQTHSPDEWDIKITGFSWEGWKRHDWDGERKWIESKIAGGYIDRIK